VPCEKFNRKTFTPAAMRLVNISGLEETFPRVATIFVDRTRSRISAFMDIYFFPLAQNMRPK